MKFIGLLALVALASASFGQLKVEKCGEGDAVTVRHVDVSPMPITFPGKLNVDVDASLNRDIQGPIGIKIRLYRKTWMVGWVKFPLCIKEIGSCDYMNICELLQDIEDRGCPRNEMAALGLDIPRCHCPLPAADLKIKFADLELPALPKALKIFTSGDYKVEARVFENGKEVTCFRAFASLG